MTPNNTIESSSQPVQETRKLWHVVCESIGAATLAVLKFLKDEFLTLREPRTPSVTPYDFEEAKRVQIPAVQRRAKSTAQLGQR